MHQLLRQVQYSGFGALAIIPGGCQCFWAGDASGTRLIAPQLTSRGRHESDSHITAEARFTNARSLFHGRFNSTGRQSEPFR